MSKSDKALLFSLLVFPGAGHFYLKRHKSGIVFSLIVIVALAKIISYTVSRANVIAEKILSGSVPLDAFHILDMVRQKPPPGEALALNVAMVALVLVWLVAAVDIYRRAKKAGGSE